jgi:flagellar hook-associated protein 2
LLRSIASSTTNGSVYTRLNDIGIERQLDGTLSLNTSKLGAAANNGTELQKLFTVNNNNAQTNGFALKFASFGTAALAAGGSVFNKAEALDKELQQNSLDQARINERAARTEERLRRQYSALDAKMASLNALSAYVNQQVTAWNNSNNN